MDCPAPGLLKLNFGIATHRNGGSFGIRSTIRDDKGRVIIARSNIFYGLFNSDLCHLIALREGLMLTKFYNLPFRIAEVSSSFICSALNSPKPLLGDSTYIINDIRALLAEVGICKWLNVPKSGNILVHKLASKAFSSVRETLWLDLSPVVGFPLLCKFLLSSKIK